MAKQKTIHPVWGGSEQLDKMVFGPGGLAVDIETRTLRVHDGERIGGTALASNAQLNDQLEGVRKAIAEKRYSKVPTTGELDITRDARYFVMPLDVNRSIFFKGSPEEREGVTLYLDVVCYVEGSQLNWPRNCFFIDEDDRQPVTDIHSYVLTYVGGRWLVSTIYRGNFTDLNAPMEAKHPINEDKNLGVAFYGWLDEDAVISANDLITATSVDMEEVNPQPRRWLKFTINGTMLLIPSGFIGRAPYENLYRAGVVFGDGRDDHWDENHSTFPGKFTQDKAVTIDDKTFIVRLPGRNDGGGVTYPDSWEVMEYQNELGHLLLDFLTDPVYLRENDRKNIVGYPMTLLPLHPDTHKEIFDQFFIRGSSTTFEEFEGASLGSLGYRQTWSDIWGRNFSTFALTTSTISSRNWLPVLEAHPTAGLILPEGKSLTDVEGDGLFGEVTDGDFINKMELLEFIDLLPSDYIVRDGIAPVNISEPWVMVRVDGKILYFPKNPIISGVDYNTLNEKGVFSGNLRYRFNGVDYKIRGFNFLRDGVEGPIEWTWGTSTNVANISDLQESEWTRVYQLLVDEGVIFDGEWPDYPKEDILGGGELIDRILTGTRTTDDRAITIEVPIVVNAAHRLLDSGGFGTGWLPVLEPILD